jgi:type IV secretory pathway VirB2 component (pilin)
MTKKVVKMLAVVLVALVLVATISPTVLGTSFKDIQVGTVTDSAQDTTGASGSVNRIIGSILTVVQIVGVGVAVIMLIVLAIKYISAAPGDKADIKKHAVVYVVGAVVLFAASGILEIVKNFAGNVHAD